MRGLSSLATKAYHRATIPKTARPAEHPVNVPSPVCVGSYYPIKTAFELSGSRTQNKQLAMWLEKNSRIVWKSELQLDYRAESRSPTHRREPGRELGRPLAVWKATEGGAERSGPTEADGAWPGRGQIRTAAASLWWEVHCVVCR